MKLLKCWNVKFTGTVVSYEGFVWANGARKGEWSGLRLIERI